jgi:hypothetical protein
LRNKRKVNGADRRGAEGRETRTMEKTAGAAIRLAVDGRRTAAARIGHAARATRRRKADAIRALHRAAERGELKQHRARKGEQRASACAITFSSELLKHGRDSGEDALR